MLTTARFAGRPASGALRCSTTVCGSGASTDVTEASELLATAAVASSLIASIENLTSLESMALPSLKVTPSRRVKVSVRPSFDVFHDVASPGTTLRSLSNWVRVP